MSSPRKLFIRTFGCQMNEYDSARTADALALSHGLVVTDRPEDADVLLVNTCSVREKAQEKVFSELGRWRALKRRNPEVVIGVGGCVASQEGAAIQSRAPYVDIVYGPQTLQRVPRMLDDVLATRERLASVQVPEPRHRHLEPEHAEQRGGRPRHHHHDQPRPVERPEPGHHGSERWRELERPDGAGPERGAGDRERPSVEPEASQRVASLRSVAM